MIKATSNLLHASSRTITTTTNKKLFIQATLSNIHVRYHGDDTKQYKNNPLVNFSFINRDNSETKVQAHVGQNLLRIGQKYDLDIEGACECSIACSTCHVILDDDLYDNLEDEITEEEEDMLDMAPGLTETSRLGCQIIVTEDMEGTKVKLPAYTRNFYTDGFKPQPH